LPATQLLDRYHELADKRLLGDLTYVELFELERIEARLDAQEGGEIERLKAVRESWQRDRSKLVVEVEKLLARLRAAD